MKKLESLREFVPEANPDDWSYYDAGQRAQEIKPDKEPQVEPKPISYLEYKLRRAKIEKNIQLKK
jgi:L-2-hydroxyglutarate oxidase LhgO